MNLFRIRRSRHPRRHGIGGYTMVEMCMAMAITSMMLAALVAGSIALQKSFAAINDCATAIDDQARISDYMAEDMRRAYDVQMSNGVLTCTVPGYFNSDGSMNNPTVSQVIGWPYKKHHHHHHDNIIVNQVPDYGASQTVKYYLGATGRVGTNPTKFYREVNGVANVIANDVSDFQLTLNDADETATTQITFAPRFRFGATASDARAGTNFYQTTLLRNTR